MVSSNDIKALELLRSTAGLRLSERGNAIINRGVPNLLRAGLIDYGRGRIAYRLTAAGKAALADNHAG